MAAFMGVTAFLSMWISNTATTAMMLPIAVATVKTIVGDDVDAEESSVSSQPEVDQVKYIFNSPGRSKPKLGARIPNWGLCPYFNVSNQENRVSRSKSILTLNLYKFGGFIQSRFASRAPSRMTSPMASQNLDMINSQLLNRDSVSQPIKASRNTKVKIKPTRIAKLIMIRPRSLVAHELP